MTPGARLAAAAEVLDAIARERASAEDVLRAWGRAHRFAGSKDRREIAARVFDVLRARERLGWRMGSADGRSLVLASLAEEGLDAAAIDALFTGEGHAPPPLADAERAALARDPGAPPPHVRAGVPAFVADLLADRFGAGWEDEARALTQDRAPLDLRLNPLRGGREAALRLLKHDGLELEATPWSALGLRLSPALSPDLPKTRAFLDGWVEVQDEASQIAAALSGAAPGMTVVDYCAGGGGKTLALAAAMGREGALHALDVNAKRLDALQPRLARAGAKAEVRRIGARGEGADDLAGRADLVFVDAPCTGSGTWRRHPEAAGRLTPETIARLAALQRDILSRASGLVKPGGRLLYATCSVFGAENDETASAFADAHPAFRPLPVARAAAESPGLTPAGRARLAELAGGAHTLQLTPRRTGTDGFFVALFEKSA